MFVHGKSFQLSLMFEVRIASAYTGMEHVKGASLGQASTSLISISLG